MKLPLKKVLLIILASVLIFLGITYSKQWGSAVATSKTQNYKAEIRALQDNPVEASAKCPQMIKNLEAEIMTLGSKLGKNQRVVKEKLIADCALASKDYSTAKNYYQKVIYAGPNFALPYRMFAKALEGDNDLGSALRYSHLAVQLDPTSFKSRVQEARILSKLNKTVKAIEAYRDALEVAPHKKVDEIKIELNTLIHHYNLSKKES